MTKRATFTEVNGRTYKIVETTGKLPYHVIIISAEGTEKTAFRCKTKQNAESTMHRFNPNIPRAL